MSLLIVLPKLFLGGAETQMRMLFEHLNEQSRAYILAVDKCDPCLSEKFKKDNNGFVYEHKIRTRNKVFRYVQELLLLLYSLFYFRWNKGVKNVLIISAWQLCLLPIMKILGFKVLYSERNTGYHKVKFIYRLIKKCDYISSNSIEAKNVLESFIHKKVEIINNAVLINNDAQPRLPQRNNSFRILIPARIDRVKNQLLVIETFKGIKWCEVHFAGVKFNEEYYKLLIKEIGHYKSQFYFDGFITDMLSYYRNFDLILLPSIQEGTSNVILECFANMFPIMVSNIEMNLRLQNNDAYVFKSNDKDSLFKQIEAFRKRPLNVIKEDLLFNYEYVKKEFSVQKMVESFRMQLS